MWPRRTVRSRAAKQPARCFLKSRRCRSLTMVCRWVRTRTMKCMRIIRRDDNGAAGKFQYHGARRIGGESAIAAELALPEKPVKRKSPPLPKSRSEPLKASGSPLTDIRSSSAKDRAPERTTHFEVSPCSARSPTPCSGRRWPERRAAARSSARVPSADRRSRVPRQPARANSASSRVAMVDARLERAAPGCAELERHQRDRPGAVERAHLQLRRVGILQQLIRLADEGRDFLRRQRLG